MGPDRNAIRRAQRAANPEKFRTAERSYRERNKERHNEKRNEWKKRNPEKVRAINRFHKYGITQQEWDAQFIAQDEVCAICKTDHPGGDLDWATDHDHMTGHLRGILCHHCNKAIGHIGDRPAVLRAAAAYLETFEKLWGSEKHGV